MAEVKIPYRLLPKQLAERPEDGLTIDEIHSDHMPQIGSIPIENTLDPDSKLYIKAITYNIANSIGPILFQPPPIMQKLVFRKS